MSTYIQLFIEFFKTGLFAIGGGLATLPFLSEIAKNYTWFDNTMLADMIAISQSTPGPIGINMATYAGFEAKGILGGVVATTALVIPSFIIIIIVAKFLKKFRESKLVNRVFETLRPAVTGLIFIAWFEIAKLSLFRIEKFYDTKNIINLLNYKAVILFLLIYYLIKKYKKHPALYLAIGAVAGIIFKL
jgi:chromate transporter